MTAGNKSHTRWLCAQCVCAAISDKSRRIQLSRWPARNDAATVRFIGWYFISENSLFTARGAERKTWPAPPMLTFVAATYIIVIIVVITTTTIAVTGSVLIPMSRTMIDNVFHDVLTLGFFRRFFPLLDDRFKKLGLFLIDYLCG